MILNPSDTILTFDFTKNIVQYDKQSRYFAIWY